MTDSPEGKTDKRGQSRSRRIHGIAGYLRDDGVYDFRSVSQVISGKTLENYEARKAQVDREIIETFMRIRACSEDEARKELGL